MTLLGTSSTGSTKSFHLGFVYVLEFVHQDVAYLMYGSLRNSYNKDLDAVQAYYIIIPAAILALLFHPSLNQFFPADVFPILNQFAWTFALYTEAVAMFPQIWVFTKRSGEIENYTSHYVACQAISRIFSFIFWTFSYHELNDPEAKSMAIVGMP